MYWFNAKCNKYMMIKLWFMVFAQNLENWHSIFRFLHSVLYMLLTTKSECFCVSFPFDISLSGSTCTMLYKYLYNAVMYYFWMVCIDFPVHECIWKFYAWFYFYIQNITCFGLPVMCTFRSLFCFEKKGKYKVVLSVNTVVGGQVSGIQW